MVQSTFTIESDIPAVLEAIAQFERQGMSIQMGGWVQYMKEQTDKRYVVASQETPYATSVLGTRQRVSGKIRGQDARYGIDSGTLRKQVIDNLKMTPEGLATFSSQAYAGFILGQFAKKGPFAPESVLFIDQKDVAELERRLGENFVQSLVGRILKRAKQVLGLI